MEQKDQKVHESMQCQVAANLTGENLAQNLWEDIEEKLTKDGPQA